jgi:hypothetical protein
MTRIASISLATLFFLMIVFLVTGLSDPFDVSADDSFGSKPALPGVFGCMHVCIYIRKGDLCTLECK